MERLEHWEELEKISLDENSNRYRRVKKALFGDPSGKIKTFAIISPENPLGLKDATEEEWVEKYKKWSDDKRGYNRDALSNLKKELLADRIKKNGDNAMRIGGFNYVQIKGKYGANEKTFIIFNISLADAKIIARDYGQESFFWGKVANTSDTNSSIGYYVTTNSCRTYNLVEVSNTIYDESDAIDFFSKYGFKYRIAMREFGDDVIPITDTKEFEESLDENRTFMSRAMHRRNSIRNPIEENKSTRLKSALFDRTHKVRSFAIITAENPSGDQLTPEENKRLRRSLNDDLRELNLQYIKIRGRYKDKLSEGTLDENSVVIINLTLGEALSLAEKYGQESFFFGNEDGISYYEVDDSGEYRKIETTNRIENKADADNLFSRFRNFKFSIYLDAFNDNTPELDLDELDKSLEEGRIVKSRLIHRRRSKLNKEIK